MKTSNMLCPATAARRLRACCAVAILAGTALLTSLSGCGGPAPWGFVLSQPRMQHHGVIYTSTLEGALPEGVEGLEIQADCGDTGTFEPIPGAVLGPDHPRFVLASVGRTPAPAGPDPAEEQLEQALAAAAETSSQVDMLLGDIPIEECVSFPECETELEALLADLGSALGEGGDALGELVAGAGSPPAEPVVLECTFQALPLGGVFLQQRPIRIDPDPRGYEDWDQTVELPKDPCEGRTPADCYREKVELWKKRACGEVDASGARVEPPPPIEQLPQPFRDICMAIRNGWVAFPDTNCQRLDGHSAGRTRRAPRSDDPMDLPVGVHDDGSGSVVWFDWSALLRESCSYAAFVHEMIHVVDNGNQEDRPRLVALSMLSYLDQAKAAREASDAARLAGDLALSRSHAQLADQLLRAAAALLEPLAQAAVDESLASECRAYLAGMRLAAQLADPAPAPNDPDAATRWLKEQPLIFLAGIDHVLHGKSPGTQPSMESRQATCACMQEMRDWATQTTAQGETRSVWECVEGELLLDHLLDDDVPQERRIETVKQRFERLRNELGCQ